MPAANPNAVPCATITRLAEAGGVVAAGDALFEVADP
jgi:hypothetical protein